MARWGAGPTRRGPERLPRRGGLVPFCSGGGRAASRGLWNFVCEGDRYRYGAYSDLQTRDHGTGAICMPPPSRSSEGAPRLLCSQAWPECQRPDKARPAHLEQEKARYNVPRRQARGRGGIGACQIAKIQPINSAWPSSARRRREGCVGIGAATGQRVGHGSSFNRSEKAGPYVPWPISLVRRSPGSMTAEMTSRRREGAQGRKRRRPCGESSRDQITAIEWIVTREDEQENRLWVVLGVLGPIVSAFAGVPTRSLNIHLSSTSRYQQAAIFEPLNRNGFADRGSTDNVLSSHVQRSILRIKMNVTEHIPTSPALVPKERDAAPPETR
jgi:hypothetical protein